MKTAIITGGARGIGKDISIALAKKGYNVVINYNTSEKQALELKEYIYTNIIDNKLDNFKYLINSIKIYQNIFSQKIYDK